MLKTFQRLVLVWILFLWGAEAWGGVQNAVQAIKVVHVHSLKQSILNQSKILFEGDVEILFDTKVHIWADFVELDKENQTVKAWAKLNATVVFENSDFVMLADSVDLNMGAKTGSAKKIKIHVREGFIAAESARKIDERTWEMEDLSFTSCDRCPAHWQFLAHKAKLFKNSVLKASGLLFKLSGFPVFLCPPLIFPLQNRAGSGFLIPRLTFDADLGFGFRQEYYYLISPTCDTTAGVSFFGKKGYLLSDEFRWARAVDNFFVATGSYAVEWNAMIERGNKIVQGTKDHYWVQGKYFQPYHLGEYPIHSLVRFDFGTDKRIGFHFLDDADLVEDTFYNTVNQRYFDDKKNIQFYMHSERCVRRQYSDFQETPKQTVVTGYWVPSDSESVSMKREREEKVTATYFPHFEWNTGYYQIIPPLLYRHDFVLDQVFLETSHDEKMYINSTFVDYLYREPSKNVNTGRVYYRGVLQSTATWLDQKIKFFVEPCFQARSTIQKDELGRNRHRDPYAIIPKVGIEWALPEVVHHNMSYSYAHYLQAVGRWSCIPKVYQKQFYHVDIFDRVYPENRLEGEIRNNWIIDDLSFDLLFRQGYEFVPTKEIFPLRRSLNNSHVTPLYGHFGLGYGDLSAGLIQEYGWKEPALLQSEVTLLWSHKKYDFFVGYVYQTEQLQKVRRLIADIPSFAHIGFSIPLNKNVLFHYDGNFYSRYKHAFPLWNGMKPMLHRVALDYVGHCWGFSLGFEEKRYRECGDWKSEHTLTFALRLESVGSFAQKFRKPAVYHAPPDYEV